MATDGSTVLHETAHWRATGSALPGARLHLVLWPRLSEYAGVDLVDLPAPVLADWWQALAWVRAEFGLTFYGLFKGYRETAVHLVVGPVDGPDFGTIKVEFR